METSDYSLSTYIKEYLVNKTDNSRYTKIRDMFTYLNDINMLYSVSTYLSITDLEGNITDIIQDEENLGNNIIIVIEQTIINWIKEYFEFIGIKFIDHISFDTMYYFIMGYFTALSLDPEHTFELDDIMSTDEEGTEEILADIISNYTPIKKHIIYESIENVDINIFIKLQTLNQAKRDATVIRDDDMSIVNIIVKVNANYDNTFIVQRIKNDGYRDAVVLEYLNDMYRNINDYQDIDIAALEIAATFYLGVDSRYNMLEYFELYFNRDVIDDTKFNSSDLANKAMSNINILKGKI